MRQRYIPLGGVLVRSLIGFLFLCSLPLSVTGQTSASSGAVEGWVFDNFGGPLAAARVLARNQQTAGVRSGATDEHGYFRLSDVPVGLYRLEVTQTGFAAFVQKDVTVNLGATVRVDAHLALATQVQQITVASQAPLINPSDGIVNLAGKVVWVLGVGCHEVASGRRRRLPDRERSQTQESMMRGFQQLPS